MKSNPDRRLNRYRIWAQKVVPRPENPGKEITDSLTTLRVDPELVDLYSETDPLKELIIPFQNKVAAGIVLELPKWLKRGQVQNYGGKFFKGLMISELTQWFTNTFMVNKRKTALSVMKQDIKKFAEKSGFALCGFTRIDRRYIAEGRDEKVPFETIAILGMEMDKDLINEIPNPGKKLFDFEVYIKSGLQVNRVAAFIRSKGYRCRARVPFEGWVKFPPHAINAGLGELGANGVVITPEFGPRQRWCLISIDADIEPDKPVDLGIAAFCDKCRRCIRACPGKAIPEERFWFRGVYKRKINDTLCWPYFVEYDGCGICLKVCPVHQYGYETCMETFINTGRIVGRNSGKKYEGG